MQKGRTSIRKQPEWIQDSFFHRSGKIGNSFHYRHKNQIAHNHLNLSVLFFILGAIGGFCYLGTMLLLLLYIPGIVAAMPEGMQRRQPLRHRCCISCLIPRPRRCRKLI
ncbi:MAG: hypothetical protein GDA43_21280 [Hormoscilla sp. SP5CHS1]|nr:hypothetical protein [Hormoscilla sp. SP5CHS1]